MPLQNVLWNHDREMEICWQSDEKEKKEKLSIAIFLLCGHEDLMGELRLTDI